MQETRVSRLLKEARAHAATQPALHRPVTPADVGRQLTSRSSSRSVLTRRLSSLSTPTGGSSTAAGGGGGGFEFTQVRQHTPPASVAGCTSGGGVGDELEGGLEAGAVAITTMGHQLIQPRSRAEVEQVMSLLLSACEKDGSAATVAMVLVEHYNPTLSCEQNVSPSLLKALYAVMLAGESSESGSNSTTEKSGASGGTSAQLQDLTVSKVLLCNNNEEKKFDADAARNNSAQLALAAAIVLCRLLDTPPKAGVRVIAEHLHREISSSPSSSLATSSSLPSGVRACSLRGYRLLDPWLQYANTAPGASLLLRDILIAFRCSIEKDETDATKTKTTSTAGTSSSSSSALNAAITLGLLPTLKAILSTAASDSSKRKETEKEKGQHQQPSSIADAVRGEVVRQAVELVRLVVKLSRRRSVAYSSSVSSSLHLLNKFGLISPLLASGVLSSFLLEEDVVVAVARTIAAAISEPEEEEEDEQELEGQQLQQEHRQATLEALQSDAATVVPVFTKALLTYQDSAMVVSRLGYSLARMLETSDSARDWLFASGDLGSLVTMATELSKKVTNDVIDIVSGNTSSTSDGWVLVRMDALAATVRLFSNCALLPAAGTFVVASTCLLDRLLAPTASTLLSCDSFMSGSEEASEQTSSSSEVQTIRSLTQELTLCFANLSYYFAATLGECKDAADEEYFTVMMDIIGPPLVTAMAHLNTVLAVAATRAWSNIAACPPGRRWIEANRVDEAVTLLLAHPAIKVQFNAAGTLLNLTADAQSAIYLQLQDEQVEGPQKDKGAFLLGQLSSLHEKCIASTNTTANTAAEKGEQQDVEALLSLARQIRHNLLVNGSATD